MFTLSVIVMAFNEDKSLEIVVSELNEKIKVLEITSEIIIIDDGSTDNTYQISKDLANRFDRLRVIRHEDNQGLGGVYRSGFTSARGEFLTFYPADGQYSGSLIHQFLNLIEDADMVLGYLPNQQRSLIASTLSRAERLLYRLLFGPLPEFQGILMFRRKILNEIELKSSGRGWGVLLELIIQAQRKGYQIVHVPIEVRPRLSGRSKVNNIKTIYANLIQALKLRLQMT
jgi:glycosyltransferase involved in cell wall biosynthesis